MKTSGSIKNKKAGNPIWVACYHPLSQGDCVCREARDGGAAKDKATGF